MRKIFLLLALISILCLVPVFGSENVLDYKNNKYFIKDKFNKEIFSLELIKNTEECLVNCEAEIKINSKNKYLTEQILKLLKINKDLKKFKKFNIEIKDDKIKIKTKKRLNVKVLDTDKRGEQKIKILNDFDWKLNILNKVKKSEGDIPNVSNNFLTFFPGRFRIADIFSGKGKTKRPGFHICVELFIGNFSK